MKVRIYPGLRLRHCKERNTVQPFFTVLFTRPTPGRQITLLSPSAEYYGTNKAWEHYYTTLNTRKEVEF